MRALQSRCGLCTPDGQFYTDLTSHHMDIIFIDDLRASTLIGIYPRERAMPQTLEISLQIGTSTASAGASDDIGDTIDYALVVERLRAELGARHFNLLERLAEYVATLLLEDFGATWVRVSIAKLGMMHGVQRVGVVIERGAAA
ncbi:MAG: Dihydroneopterin aldolase [Candidatus Accumulibacter vicinus]|uniref:Dihydroneopterin aldolase n=2 Tax=Candidatus Accumulibacter vicinus TaxID=2954382 RepID=A0A084Y4G0_9PROT|nr:MAG: Dihydroneopterin aldolase [Candidatus Accumulibacter vicinus]